MAARGKRPSKRRRALITSFLLFIVLLFFYTLAIMAKLPQITNLYVIAGLATIGGLIQGFDVSSLSAIIGTKQVRDILS